MEAFFGWLILVAIAWGVWWTLRPLYRRWRTRPHGDGASSPSELKAVLEQARGVGLEFDWDQVDRERLALSQQFQQQVDRLSQADVPFEEVARLAKSERPGVAALGLSAIARRSDVPEDWPVEAVKSLSHVSGPVEPFVYAALLEKAHSPVIGPVLSKFDEGLEWQALASFIEQRRERGEEINLDTFRHNVPVRFVGILDGFIDRYENYLGEDFRGLFEEWKRTAVDVEFLRQIGRVLHRPYDEPPAFLAGRRAEVVELLEDALEQKPPRSVLLVGEHGVGKSRVVRAALDRLPEKVVFEASAAEINAGAVWIGELEGRIKELAEKLEGHSVVWLLPGFE